MKHRNLAIWIVTGLVLAALDQLSKYIYSLNHEPFRNYLFAFSLPVPPVIMYLFYGIAVAMIIAYVRRNHRIFAKSERIAWTLILAGSLSNIIERLVTGYVKDFIPVFTGIFNVADIYILVGIFLLLFVKDSQGLERA